MSNNQKDANNVGAQSRLTVVLEVEYAYKALSILLAMAQTAAAGKSVTIDADWGFGTGTLKDQDGAHTHFGSDAYENDQKDFEAFIDGLHGLLVEERGLSWVDAANA